MTTRFKWDFQRVQIASRPYVW